MGIKVLSLARDFMGVVFYHLFFFPVSFDTDVCKSLLFIPNWY
jgi:hypothetical protein